MKLGFIGFGDAGMSIARGLSRDTACEFVIFSADRELAEKNCGEVFENTEKYCIADNISQLLHQVQLVFVLVPCSEDVNVFSSIVKIECQNKLFIDCCSASPGIKKAISADVTKIKCRYIDAAIMETVATKMHRTPIIISGLDADAVADFLNNIGMNISVVGNEAGQASLIKICRSSFMKGLAALLLETDELSTVYGVKEFVFDSIAQSWNDNEFIQYSQKLISAAKLHAKRQGEELKHVISLQKKSAINGEMSVAALAVYNKLL